MRSIPSTCSYSPGLDLVDRWAVVANRGDTPVTLESVQSAAWYVPASRDYRLTHLSGDWGREYGIEHVDLTQAAIRLGSRTGLSGPHATPFFALDLEGKATEESGQVWFGALHWSGNWKIVVEKNNFGQVRVTDRRLPISKGYSYVHLPGTAGGGHIGVAPNFVNKRTTPLSYRGAVAMLGSCSVSLVLDESEGTTHHGHVRKRIRAVTVACERAFRAPPLPSSISIPAKTQLSESVQNRISCRRSYRELRQVDVHQGERSVNHAPQGV